MILTEANSCSGKVLRLSPGNTEVRESKLSPGRPEESIGTWFWALPQLSAGWGNFGLRSAICRKNQGNAYPRVSAEFCLEEPFGVCFFSSVCSTAAMQEHVHYPEFPVRSLIVRIAWNNTCTKIHTAWGPDAWFPPVVLLIPGQDSHQSLFSLCLGVLCEILVKLLLWLIPLWFNILCLFEAQGRGGWWEHLRMCTGNQRHCKANRDGQRTTYVLEMPWLQPSDWILFVLCQLLGEIPEWLRPPGHCSTSSEYFCIFSQMAPWFNSFLSSFFSLRACYTPLLPDKESFMT